MPTVTATPPPSGAPRAADPTRAADLRRIHAAARARGLDAARERERYEALLFQVTGQRSARALDAAQRATLLRHLGQLPAPPAPPARPPGQAPRPPQAAAWPAGPAPASVSAPQWRYLCYLIRAMALTEAHFAALVKHIVGLDNWRWLDVPGARALIAGLRRIQAAPAGRPAQPRRGAPRYPT